MLRARTGGLRARRKQDAGAESVPAGFQDAALSRRFQDCRFHLCHEFLPAREKGFEFFADVSQPLQGFLHCARIFQGLGITERKFQLFFFCLQGGDPIFHRFQSLKHGALAR